MLLKLLLSRPNKRLLEKLLRHCKKLKMRRKQLKLKKLPKKLRPRLLLKTSLERQLRIRREKNMLLRLLLSMRMSLQRLLRKRRLPWLPNLLLNKL